MGSAVTGDCAPAPKASSAVEVRWKTPKPSENHPPHLEKQTITHTRRSREVLLGKVLKLNFQATRIFILRV
jgi:hypothetical protein